MSQSRLTSALEAIFNTTVAMLVALLTQYVVFAAYEMDVTHQEQFEILGIFTAVSMARNYIVRRFFNHVSTRKKNAEE